MNLSKKLRIAMIETNTSQTELAELTNQSQANLSKKMIADNYKIKEFEKLVNALGCQLEVNIILPDGKVIK